MRLSFQNLDIQYDCQNVTSDLGLIENAQNNKTHIGIHECPRTCYVTLVCLHMHQHSATFNIVLHSILFSKLL